MEEAPQNYKESSHSAYANGMNETGRQKILHCMIASIPWLQSAILKPYCNLFPFYVSLTWLLFTNDVVHCVSCFFPADGEMASAPSF